MAETEIQWTGWRRPDGTIAPGFTFNPWSGCTRVSRACTHCYAEHALPSMRRGAEWGPTAPRIHASEAYWRGPVKWNAACSGTGERRRVFCASMADVFEQHRVPEEQAKLDEARRRLWRLILDTPSLDWLLLTKRPQAMAQWAEEHGWPRNAVAGCTAEGQLEFDQRIGHLLAVPARTRFLSVEPMVGGLVVPQAVLGPQTVANLPGRPPIVIRPHGIDWVIIGGESGAGAAMLDVDAAQALVTACTQARVATFMKQMGSAWAQAHGASTARGATPPSGPRPCGCGSGTTTPAGRPRYATGATGRGRAPDA